MFYFVARSLSLQEILLEQNRKKLGENSFQTVGESSTS
jgi:hypothetical protein